MGIELNLSRLPLAQERLDAEGLAVMRECAEEGHKVAYARARVDEGDMRDGIEVVETPDGAQLVGSHWLTIWHEYGTGVYAGDADPQYPDQRPSTGSEADEVPWVYRDENGNFWTTYGVRPQPMIRPGYVAGREQFEVSKRRRGL